MAERLDDFMAALEERNPGEDVFHQAVRSVMADVIDDALADERVRKAHILERMTEPDRTIMFRVAWETDEGEICANRAFRVQFNNSIGPYKGGLRFVPGLELATLKFLGFEQTLKNALTGFPMGGAKGGADFDPKGRSEGEVMRFCQSFMAGLFHYIGEDVDVPAGDVNVGAREIAFMFGQYKRLANRFAGVLTGKGLSFGGSAVRSEATGYGAAYFAALMLEHGGADLEGKRCTVSGSGNVSLYCAEKLAELGAVVVSLSDSDGTVHDPDGISADKLEFVKELKQERRGRISEYAEEYDVDYDEGGTPWGIECDLAFPCATENELGESDAKQLIDNGCIAFVEGSNMPLDAEAEAYVREQGILLGPGKAANAGGVAVSALEQSQNAVRMSLTRDQVDGQLRDVMERIHGACAEKGEVDGGRIDYVRGANRAGFEQVREAMLAQGAV